MSAGEIDAGRDLLIVAVWQYRRGAGIRPLARSATCTQFNPTLKAVYTRDPDGHFIEIIESD